MSRNATRNVSLCGLEVRHLNPGIALYKAGTLTQLRHSSLAQSCFFGSLLLYALTAWYIYVTSFAVLFVFPVWR
jgi:hypothetical protein